MGVEIGYAEVGFVLCAAALGCGIPWLEHMLVRRLVASRTPERQLNALEGLLALLLAYAICVAPVVVVARISQIRGPILGISVLFGWGVGALLVARRT